MRQFVFADLTRDEFAGFAAHARHGNFQQTVMMADLRVAQGQTVDYVGVREDGTLVAAALVVTHGSGPTAFSTIADGPLCDLDDRELTVFFLDRIAAMAKRRRHAVHLDITPEQPYRLRDAQGEPLPGPQGAPDTAMMENLEAAGMTHGGFTRGYTAVPRWRFLKDLDGVDDGAALLKTFSKRTQWSVKRAQSMGVEVRHVGPNELGVFAAIEQQTAERRHFEYRGEQYFRRFAEAFGDDVHFLVARIDTQAYHDAMRRKRDDLQRLVDDLDAKLAQRETTKLRRRHNEESNNLAAATKRYEEAATLLECGAFIPVAASMFVTVPQETVYLFSGSVEEYKPFYASALIQHEAMVKLCLDKGITRYNFYGIDGVFDDPDSEGHGVLEFKQGFNGHVEELVGEFVMPVCRARLALRNALKKVLG